MSNVAKNPLDFLAGRRAVLWGGHPEKDRWIGSEDDRLWEGFRRVSVLGLRLAADATLYGTAFLMVDRDKGRVERISPSRVSTDIPYAQYHEFG